MSFDYAAIVFVRGNDYKIHFWYMSKDGAINLLRNANFTEKSGTLETIKILHIAYKNDKRNYV